MTSIRKERKNGEIYYSLVKRIKVKDKWKYKTIESYGTNNPEKFQPQIFKGFAEEELKKLPDKSVNLIIIDPPYGIEFNTNYRKDKPENIGEISLDNEAIFKTLPDVIRESYRILKEGSALYCFCRWDVADRFKEMLSKYFIIKNNLIWMKNNWSMGDLEGAYAAQYENIFFCVKGRHKLNKGRSPDILKFDRVSNQKLKHSHQKPLDLLDFLIKKSSKAGDVVLDCYAGSGSTLVSAKRLMRKSIGIELDEDYINIIEDRLKTHKKSLTNDKGVSDGN